MLHDPLRDSGLECKTGDEPLGTVVIEVAPSFDHRGLRLPDKFDAFLSDERIARATTTPFCCAARELIKRGLSPDTILSMQHRGSGTESLKATISIAARLTVREDRCGPRFSPWKALCLRAVGAPIAPTLRALIPHQRRPPQ
jgi:hypothetical protein